MEVIAVIAAFGGVAQDRLYDRLVGVEDGRVLSPAEHRQRWVVAEVLGHAGHVADHVHTQRFELLSEDGAPLRRGRPCER